MDAAIGFKPFPEAIAEVVGRLVSGDGKRTGTSPFIRNSASYSLFYQKATESHIRSGYGKLAPRSLR
ncbi:hypothetical protein ACFXDE_09545 [Kitasatospora sp. NPDC059408]|uniref:hypothetical protein n=1 Tax=Kitasatospora sp. NPDC059408 TaxID=3346823 RepID=UPI00368F7909